MGAARSGGLDSVDRPVGELVHAPDVIRVAVRRDGEHGVTDLVLDEMRQRREPQ